MNDSAEEKKKVEEWILVDDPKDSTETATNGGASAGASKPSADQGSGRVVDDIPRSKPIPIPRKKEERRWEVPNHTPPK